MYLVDLQSHLVCENTMLMIPPIVDEPLQPLNLVEYSESGVHSACGETNLERHELQV